MGVSDNQLGGLYSDERAHPILTPSAQRKFEHYQSSLAALSLQIRLNDSDETGAPTPWKTWENGLRQIYKEMIYDAFTAQGIEIPKGMEVYFASSLAKAQATEYSDLDAFVLVKDEADVAKIKPVFLALNNLCQRIFTENSQLFPDPIGINPSKLIGTPQELFGMLKDGLVPDVEATTRSILTSKPVFPGYELGEDLRAMIHAEPSFKKFVSAVKFYNMGVQDFGPPRVGADKASVKCHIMRPIDFILMGLREEFNLYSEDGSHLSAPGTLKLLRKKKLLPEAEIARIETVYNQAMEIRFNLHAEHHAEHDDLPIGELRELLTEVAKIRELGASRIDRIKNLNKAAELWDEAYRLLEKGQVKNYFTAAYALKIFLVGNNLSPEDLRPVLKEREISPKAFSTLEGIFKVSSTYSIKSSTFGESVLETASASSVGVLSAFFMDCKLKQNERANPDPNIKVNKASILIAILQFIKEMADPVSKILANTTKALMSYKIAAVRQLDREGKADRESLAKIMSSKGEDLAQFTSYKYATKEGSRDHQYKASVANNNQVKEKYKTLEGDTLKTEILLDFRAALAEAKDKDGLAQIVKTIKNSAEYKILATGQGFTTRFFGLNTSSVSAFNKMVNEMETDFVTQDNVHKMK